MNQAYLYLYLECLEFTPEIHEAQTAELEQTQNQVQHPPAYNVLGSTPEKYSGDGKTQNLNTMVALNTPKKGFPCSSADWRPMTKLLSTSKCLQIKGLRCVHVLKEADFDLCESAWSAEAHCSPMALDKMY